MNQSNRNHHGCYRFPRCAGAIGTVVTLLALLMSIACSSRSELREVTLALSWVHQAQFSGPYYADQYGLYAKEGLRVTFVPGSVDRDPVKEFVAGKYDFVISQPDSLIKERIAGHRIQAIAATYRIHPIVYISLKSSGIDEPQDLRGKKVGVAYSEEPILKAMLKRMSIDQKEVNIVPREYNLDSLQKGDIDVQGAWLTNEVQTAQEKGLALNTISPYDYGISFYADLFAARESLIQADPELVEKFVRATMAGWELALQSPDEHGKLSLRYDAKLDAPHEIQLLKISAPLIHTGVDRIGWMQIDAWQDMVQALYEDGAISEKPNAADLFTVRFLTETRSSK